MYNGGCQAIIDKYLKSSHCNATFSVCYIETKYMNITGQYLIM